MQKDLLVNKNMHTEADGWQANFGTVDSRSAALMSSQMETTCMSGFYFQQN